MKAFHFNTEKIAKPTPFGQIRIMNNLNQLGGDFIYQRIACYLREKIFSNIPQSTTTLKHNGGRLIRTAFGGDNHLVTHPFYVSVKGCLIAGVETQKTHQDSYCYPHTEDGKNSSDPSSFQVFICQV